MSPFLKAVIIIVVRVNAVMYCPDSRTTQRPGSPSCWSIAVRIRDESLFRLCSGWDCTLAQEQPALGCCGVQGLGSHPSSGGVLHYNRIWVQAPLPAQPWIPSNAQVLLIPWAFQINYLCVNLYPRPYFQGNASRDTDHTGRTSLCDIPGTPMCFSANACSILT